MFRAVSDQARTRLRRVTVCLGRLQRSFSADVSGTTRMCGLPCPPRNLARVGACSQAKEAFRNAEGPERLSPLAKRHQGVVVCCRNTSLGRCGSAFAPVGRTSSDRPISRGRLGAGADVRRLRADSAGFARFVRRPGCCHGCAGRRHGPRAQGPRAQGPRAHGAGRELCLLVSGNTTRPPPGLPSAGVIGTASR